MKLNYVAVEKMLAATVDPFQTAPLGDKNDFRERDFLDVSVRMSFLFFDLLERSFKI